MDRPASIGKYDLEEFLGGGMSHVYRAKDRLLGRTVCIKVLTPQGTADAEVRDRFLQEARMAGNFCHDNVVSIYDFGEDNGNPFLVMEYLRGDTLRTLIDERRVGNIREVLQIALQLARALECVHAQKVIHRDIKPENVHVNAQGVVKLMDFGVAKMHGLNLTQAGFILGTPYYMAPEQIRGEDITPSIDIYAFGVLLYELLAGQKPYRADTPEAIFYAIVHQNADLAPLQQGKVPAVVQNLITRCMSKSPADRPTSFGEISRTLETLVSSLGGETQVQPAAASPASAEEPPPKPKSSIGWYAGAAAAVLAAIAAVFFVMHSRTQIPVHTAVAPVKVLSATLSTNTGDMLLVPAGDFLFGKDKQRMTLPAFYIDKTEVTNREYGAYCAAVGCTSSGGNPDVPITGVTFDQAQSFAQWAGKRLPSAEEWEKAARGTDGRDFPWGNTPDASYANVHTDAVLPVTDYKRDISPNGALQMAGNVGEMVNSPTQPSPLALTMFARVLKPPPTASERWMTIKGASYLARNINDAVSYEFSTAPVRFTRKDLGFRCAKDAPK